MTRITSSLGLALLLCASACTKKTTPAQPTTPQAAPAPAPDATGTPPAPAAEPVERKPTKDAPGARRASDPCSGGEIK